jgi:Flp pilus assembly pilin Flp
MKSLIREVLANQEGGSLVEYVLLLSLVALVCVAGIALIGNGLKPKTEPLADALNK